MKVAPSDRDNNKKQHKANVINNSLRIEPQQWDCLRCRELNASGR